MPKKNRKNILILFCVLQNIFLPGYAEEIGEAPINLKPKEIEELKAVIAKPINPNSLNITISEAYEEKDAAAFKLGDAVAREAILREWVSWASTHSVDYWTSIKPRWSLGSFLFQTENRKEAYEIKEQLIKEVKNWPPSELRIRVQVANQYLNDHNLIRAKRLLDEADEIILTQWGGPFNRDRVAPYWKNRAELEFYRVKARYFFRIGKWEEGFSFVKKSTESGISLLSVENLVGIREKNFGRIATINAFVDLAGHQINAGMYAQADITLRDTYVLTSKYGFSEKQLNHFYNTAADLQNSNGQFRQGLKYASHSEKINADLGFKKGSNVWLHNETRKLTSLIGQDQWTEALIELGSIDSAVNAVNGNANFAKVPYLRGYVYLKNNKYLEALKLYEDSLKWNIANFGENHYLTSYIRGMYATALWKTGDVAQSKKQFEQSVKAIVSPNSLSGDFVEDAFRKKYKKYILSNYIELLAGNNKPNLTDIATIFELADALNTSSIQSAVSDAAVRATVNIGGLSEIIRQEQDAKNEIASLNSYVISQSTEGAQKRNLQVIDQMRLRLNELQLSRNKFKTRIEKEYPDYFQLIQPKSPSIKELAATLKEDELFILILPLESTSYLFAIDKVGNVQFHKTNKGEADYVQIVQRIRKTLDLAEFKTAKPPNFEFSDSYGLYQTIFSSLESFLTGKRHLIVSSSGALSNLPFSVLMRQPFSGGSYDGAPWLINKLAISYVPSASAWIALNSFSMTQSASQPLIAWADPIFSFQTAGVTSGSVQSSTRPISITRSTLQIGIDQSLEQSFLAYNKLPPLPETRDEVIQISKSLNDSNLDDLFLGKTATRESVLKASISGRLAKKKVVIFATHGLQPLDFPGLNEPALAMAITDDPNQSPLLTLRDVMGLKMNADWTVLSACNTAGADGKAGEALSGLARGFFFAGSRSLLVTHWSVESESAMLLTTKTFDSYNRDQNIRRAESLRLAMLDLMKNPRFAHPAYWAPFVLVGDGGR